MLRSILYTAFHPPKFHDQIYLRERCLKKLVHASDKRMTFIQAGAGFGKTCLLASLYERITQEKLWFSLPEGCFNVTKVLLHLFYGLMGKCDHRTRERWEGVLHNMLIGTLEDDQMVTNLIALTEEIPGELFLFIDDLQFLQFKEREKELSALQMFARFAPAKVHFIVASREELPIPVTRFRMESQLLEMNEADLVFDREELLVFLRDCGFDVGDEALDWLMRKTEGWIAGVCLMLYFYDLHQVKEEGLGAILPVKEYMAEMFKATHESTRNFLQKTCIFDTISAEISDEYLGISDSRRILDELVEYHLLVHRYEEDGAIYYRFHNLLKEYFLDQLDLVTKNQYHLQLARVYGLRGEIGLQIAHLLAAEEEEQAIELIKVEAPLLCNSADLTILDEWLNCLEGKAGSTDPLLNYYRGWVLETRGAFAQALTFYQKAELELKDTGDLIHLLRVRVQMAGLLWWLERYQEAFTLSEDALTLLPPGETRIAAGLYYYMGASACVLKERGRGLAYLAKGLEMARESKDLLSESLIQAYLGFAGYLPDGDLETALMMCEEALKNFRKLRNKPGVALALTNLGYVFLVCYDLSRAEEVLKEAEGLYHELNNQRANCAVWGLLCRVALAQGNILQVEEYLQKMERSMGTLDEVARMPRSLYFFAHSCLLLHKGEEKRAEEVIQQAVDCLKESGDAQHLTVEYRIQGGLLYFVTGRLSEAAGVFTEVYNGACQTGYRLIEAEAALLLEIVQREQGVMGLESQNAVARLTGGPYEFLLKKYAHWLEDADERSRSLYKPKLKLLEYVGEFEPLRIRFFGEFLVLNGDLKLTSKDWTNRKAIDLLKYLLLHHDCWVRQEELLDTFWPESELEKGKQSLYVALHAVRRKWEPELQKGKESHLIQSKRGMYRIHLPEPYWLDLEVFKDFLSEGMRLYRDRCLVKAVEFLEEAHRIYIGDFLEENQYDEWTQGFRYEYLQDYLQLLVILAKIYGECGEYGRAVPLLQTALTKNPLQDQVHVLMMTSLMKLGQKKEAVQHYRQYSELYRAELGVEMPEEIKMLYKELMG